MEETSLSDFVGDDAGEAAGEPTDAAVDAGDSPGEVLDESATADSTTADSFEAAAADDEPDCPTVTAAWVPGGDTCERCGESAGWLWVDGDGRVCRACKDW